MAREEFYEYAEPTRLFEDQELFARTQAAGMYRNYRSAFWKLLLICLGAAAFWAFGAMFYFEVLRPIK